MAGSDEVNMEQPGQSNDPIQPDEVHQNQANDIPTHQAKPADDLSEGFPPRRNEPSSGEIMESSHELNDTHRGNSLDEPMKPEAVNSSEIPTVSMPGKEVDQSLFRQEDINDLQSRWKSIQGQFVDEPCSAVEQGEALVAETLERVKQMFSEQQQSISHQWLNHDDITTEELRTTLLNYRALLLRILKL